VASPPFRLFGPWCPRCPPIDEASGGIALALIGRWATVASGMRHKEENNNFVSGRAVITTFSLAARRKKHRSLFACSSVLSLLSALLLLLSFSSSFLTLVLDTRHDSFVRSVGCCRVFRGAAACHTYPSFVLHCRCQFRGVSCPLLLIERGRQRSDTRTRLSTASSSMEVTV
jgi:hypothetical protein